MINYFHTTKVLCVRHFVNFQLCKYECYNSVNRYTSKLKWFVVFREHVQAKTLCITTFRRLYPITTDFLKKRTKSVTVFKHCDDFLTDQQFCSLRINLYCIIQCHILKIHPPALQIGIYQPPNISK